MAFVINSSIVRIARMTLLVCFFLSLGLILVQGVDFVQLEGDNQITPAPTTPAPTTPAPTTPAPTTPAPTTPAPTTPAPTTPAPTTPAPTTPAPTTPAPTTPAPTTPAPTTLEKVIEIYHFHGIHQCTSCILVDEYTRYTLDTFFAAEVSSGSITYMSINYENECPDIVAWLNVYGSSIYIVERWAEGETEIHNLTYKLWGLTPIKDNYVAYLSSYLEGLQ